MNAPTKTLTWLTLVAVLCGAIGLFMPMAGHAVPMLGAIVPAVGFQSKKTATWCLIAVGCVSGFEGLRTAAYADPVGIPTICFGETQGVKLGQVATVDECKAMLASSLEKANASVNVCTKVPLSDTRRAALVSFTYNVGGSAYCTSTLVKKMNAGDTVGACNELLRWTKATKAGVRVELPGLVKRRQTERTMCMQGVM